MLSLSRFNSKVEISIPKNMEVYGMVSSSCSIPDAICFQDPRCSSVYRIFSDK